jgi:sugar phosphate isomerase/epimerase
MWPLMNADWNFWPNGLSSAEAFSVCSDLGFAGMEIGVYRADEELSPDRVAELRSRAEIAGVAIDAVLYSMPSSRWPEGGLSSSARGAAVTDIIETGLRASQLHASVLGIWPGADLLTRETDYAIAWDQMIRSFSEVMQGLESTELRVAVEYKPLELVDGAVAALRLTDAVPGLGVVLDTGHALWAKEDLPITVRMLAPRLVHVHLGDTAGDIDSDLPPGRYHDFTHFFRALAASGYMGWLSFDMYEAVASGEASGYEASREGLDYVTKAIAMAGVAP